MTTLPEKDRTRFDASYAIDPVTRCWMWQRAKNRKGYGQFRYNGKMHITSRLSFQMHKGQITKACVCHTCDTPSCVNPEHLFEGSHLDNARDKIAKGRDYHRNVRTCPHGHDYTAENTYVDKRGHRCCRTCMRAKKSRWHVANRDYAIQTMADRRARLKAEYAATLTASDRRC